MAKDVSSASMNWRDKTPKMKAPKVVEHMRIHPAMGGGVTVAHHFTSMEHEPEVHKFGADQGMAFHEHMATHTGMPMDSEGETNSDAPEGE